MGNRQEILDVRWEDLPIGTEVEHVATGYDGKVQKGWVIGINATQGGRYAKVLWYRTREKSLHHPMALISLKTVSPDATFRKIPTTPRRK